MAEGGGIRFIVPWGLLPNIKVKTLAIIEKMGSENR
jgi:hypothetical protein